jgi:uncharacterized membrane protein YciS (DUF1049 family)
LIALFIVGLPALTLYLGLMWVRAKRVGGIPAGQSSKEFDVFVCGTRRKAVSRSLGSGIVVGALFSGFFYLSAPVLIWRYGLPRSIWLFAVPFICAAGASYAFDYSDPFLNGVVQGVARVAISVWLAANDRALFLAQLRRRGWTQAGTCSAELSAAALRNSFSSTPAPVE